MPEIILLNDLPNCSYNDLTFLYQGVFLRKGYTSICCSDIKEVYDLVFMDHELKLLIIFFSFSMRDNADSISNRLKIKLARDISQAIPIIMLSHYDIPVQHNPKELMMEGIKIWTHANFSRYLLDYEARIDAILACA